MFSHPRRQPPRYQALDEELFFSRVQPEPLTHPRLVHFNRRLGESFVLSAADFSKASFLDFLAGRRLPSKVLAMAYSGHQFGGFNPALGDGRAMLLGEFADRQGKLWEFQLKGSGPTPYSRGFDGRAVLRSVIREYLASEALWALNIPTTRALCVIDSDTPVVRETVERGAMMIRVAPTHLRFGSFEHFYARRQIEPLRQLADFCIDHYFPHLRNSPAPYPQWFAEVVRRTAGLVARWQAHGFCHGVMNTDNFSILGLTFDYGPFGFLETYAPAHICNHSDHEGRYAYEMQPRMALWNCYCLAQALTPLIDRESLQQALDGFEPELQKSYRRCMGARLGLNNREEGEDPELIAGLLALMENEKLDYSRFLRGLSHWAENGHKHPWLYEKGNPEAIDNWLDQYRARLARDPDPRRSERMLACNPKYILRNYIAQEVIEAAQAQDYSLLEQILKLLHRPFDEHPGWERYAEPAPAWACGLSVSCSS